MQSYREASVIFNKKIKDDIYFCKLKTKINAKAVNFLC